MSESNTSPNLSRLARFVHQMTELVDQPGIEESSLLAQGQTYLSDLINNDDWLPDEFAEPHPEHYQQYLLHCDPKERFSVVSFVWGPGQKTPVHDHTVWGLVGMMRGEELARRYEVENGTLTPKEEERLRPGEIDAVSPNVGDIHSVANAFDDRVSISIHVYGNNIGKVERHVFKLESGEKKDFISGYANTRMPNIWGLDAQFA